MINNSATATLYPTVLKFDRLVHYQSINQSIAIFNGFK